MSDAIGPVSVAHKEESIFLGRELQQRGDISQKTAEIIDDEVHRIIADNYKRGVEILTKKRDILDKMADALLERETLHKADIDLLMEGKPLPPFKKPDPQGSPSKTPEESKEDNLLPIGKQSTGIA